VTDNAQPPVEIGYFHFRRHTVHVTDEWPAWTRLPEAWLKRVHGYGGKVQGDELVMTIGNGKSRYRLHRDDVTPEGILAELVEGNDRTSLKRLAKKFEAPTDDEG